MNRRIKNRIPPAVLAGLRAAVPIMLLVVSANIVLTPEAHAQVQAGTADAVFVKTYTKEELKQGMPPNPVEDLDTRIANELTGLFRRVTAQTSTSATAKAWRALRTQEPDEDTVRTHLSALKDKPETARADIDKIRTLFAGETQKAASTRVKNGLKVLDTVNAGIAFNLDLGSLFGGSDAKPTASAKPAPSAGTLRYGLVLKEINPDASAIRTASLDDSFESMDFAGHAEVKWTIGPLEEQESRRIFNFQEMQPAAPASDGSLWSRIRIPKLSFKGKATPENLDNLAKVSETNRPGMRFDFAQVEGIYWTTQRMGSDGKMLPGEHNLRVPTGVGDLAVGRRFDDRFKVVQTSAYNILIDRRLPVVSVHYLNVEQRYKGEIGYTMDGHTISAAAQGRAEGKVPKEDQRPERYSLGYGKNF